MEQFVPRLQAVREKVDIQSRQFLDDPCKPNVEDYRIINEIYNINFMKYVDFTNLPSKRQSKLFEFFLRIHPRSHGINLIVYNGIQPYKVFDVKVMSK